MDKIQAQEFISNVFQSKFDPEQYTLLVRNLLNNFEYRDNPYQGGSLWEAYREHINHYRRIGKYTDPNSDAMDILIVEVKSLSKLDRARTSLRNFVVKHLQTFEKDYALAAFYSKEDGGKDWRFSFIKIEIESERTEEGKIKARKELSPAKRYSFLVGAYENSYTAQKQLLPLLLNDYSKPTIEDIENAFSIEKVTDEFFQQYKELYLKLSENKDLSEILIKAGLEPVRFTKKLLGQIVFLYFLQKKGWLGVPKSETWGKGDKKYMQNLFNEAVNNGRNYFKGYLQYLFYEALAKDRRDNADPVYYRRFDCKIPFLNGGLFEADYEWERTNIIIPNNLFRNQEKNKAGDKGTGIFDVFDRYNFTIKEDEPLEKEVAVDPEMLGKVFENMLEIKERKSKGAYYTPREIVHYMCQESLINYIDTAVNDYSATYQAVNTDQLNIFGGSHNKKGQMTLEIEHKNIRVPKEDIELFIRKGYLAVENDKQVLSKGKETDRYKFQLPESIQVNADLIDEKLTTIKICDPAIGSGAFPVGLLHELVIAKKVLLPFLSKNYLTKKLETIELKQEEYKQDPERYIYKIKRHTIQESIYGVDIDASAIDIARLRLWLSLIVDEEDFYNIEALPNLDYKIVQGDTLVGFPDDWKSEAFDKIERLKEEFFDETNALKKKTLKAQIDKEINDRLKTSKQVFGYEVNFDFKLFFSEVWHNKKGFDIVIANPPYVDIKHLPPSFVRFLFQHFSTCANRINLYSIFIEKAWKITNSSGNIVFINPNSILQNSSYKKIRQLLVNDISKIIKLPDKVFKEAIVETIINSISRNNKCNVVKGAYYKNSDKINFNSIVFSDFSRNEWLNDENYQFNIFIQKGINIILKRIENNADVTENFFDFSLGITPYDKYKGHSKETIEKRLFHSKEKLNDEYVPLIAGENILRYAVLDKPIKEFLHYGDWLGAPRQRRFFTEPRIIVRQIISGRPGRIYAGFTMSELYHTQIGFAILSKSKNVKEIEILSIILNSDVINFYHKYKFLDIEKITFQKILIENCRALPFNKNYNILTKATIILHYLIYLQLSSQSNSMYFKYFDEILNAVTFELYFQEEVISANKEIIKHLGNIQSIDNSMPNEEKLAIIQVEFNRLYDPDHPVRNNLETLDSVEEVRIIKEALK